MSHITENHCDNNEEPQKKKYCFRSRAPQKLRKQNSRKCKNIFKKPPLNLCDLPAEILEKIFGYINIWHHNRLRGTCRRLKDVHDIFVMHEFQTASQKEISLNPNSEVSAALQVIKQATEIYVQSGYESVFCGCILPMLRSSYRNPFCPNFGQIKKFLAHFYCTVTDLIGETCSQRWRLLYTITVMRLIKAFNKSVIASDFKPLHWRTVIELRGPWLGTLWTLKGRPLKQSRHRCNLLVILAEMLIANITEIAFKHVWECPSEVYVFGNDTSNSNRVPTTIFTFTVYGSKKICNLFRSCLEEESEQFQQPLKLPNDQFTVNLDIICKEAMKWGCSKSQHMEIGPFSEKYYGEEDDPENNLNSENNFYSVL